MPALALGQPVTLHVGVHREAGTVYDVAVDGAAGQCTVGPSRISCPARGPVRFRWGPDDAWEVAGDVELHPGETGRAWVLAVSGSREAERARLAWDVVDEAAVLELWVPAGDRHPPPPSLGMLADVLALAEHPDRRVRMAVLDGLLSWVRGTFSDPMAREAPSILPEGWLTHRAEDPDPAVRVRVVRLLREVSSEELRDEAAALLVDLATDGGHRRVRRAALNGLGSAPRRELLPAEEAWVLALDAVPLETAQGRAACNTLGRLASHAEPNDVVVPEEAIARCIVYHPERVWRLWVPWREEVPFHRPWVDSLLRATDGLRRELIVYWEETAPEALQEALDAWEPGPPHTERYAVIERWRASVHKDATD